jgi:hypothetical protein
VTLLNGSRRFRKIPSGQPDEKNAPAQANSGRYVLRSSDARSGRLLTLRALSMNCPRPRRKPINIGGRVAQFLKPQAPESSDERAVAQYLRCKTVSSLKSAIIRSPLTIISNLFCVENPWTLRFEDDGRMTVSLLETSYPAVRTPPCLADAAAPARWHGPAP